MVKENLQSSDRKQLQFLNYGPSPDTSDIIPYITQVRKYLKKKNFFFSEYGDMLKTPGHWPEGIPCGHIWENMNIK